MAQNEKPALQKLIKDIDVLDFHALSIDRKKVSTSKKTKVSDFSRSVTTNLDEERDLLLICIKIK